ncbi:nitrate reductase [Microvirga tunisiensis]|uniref:Nitrate reductase n=2 Tax=Pannonibacter tanglangensis TaxID=2750084 RepID=A0A7X5F545_9HYPH|nr:MULTISPECIES: nitrate reductase [unclassified Pannonibacter]NBN65097.1 nitrate reductase [Pannonibacter sp. XCT-34]NBN79927.1 nitrate reductase [Pannonibacter sp. XCT-53]
MTFSNPLAPRALAVPTRLREVKGWVRSHFALDEDTAISVSELACRDEGCPDIETVIGLLRAGQPGEVHRLHKPLLEISEADVAALALVSRLAHAADPHGTAAD